MDLIQRKLGTKIQPSLETAKLPDSEDRFDFSQILKRNNKSATIMRAFVVCTLLLCATLYATHALSINDVINENYADELYQKEAVKPECNDYFLPCKSDSDCCKGLSCKQPKEFEESVCLM
uniref:Uncharacterized protein n=1 Tax=Clytia hemisphaerica TaxID=252671 RepID=A0A7M5URG7_9CNID